MSRQGCLMGGVIVFAILGVMFFLGQLVPTIVQWLLSEPFA
jgi:hypothetical protein